MRHAYGFFHTGGYSFRFCQIHISAIAILLEQVAKGLSPDKIVIINLCGRGDKDIKTIVENLGEVD